MGAVLLATAGIDERGGLAGLECRGHFFPGQILDKQRTGLGVDGLRDSQEDE